MPLNFCFVSRKSSSCSSPRARTSSRPRRRRRGRRSRRWRASPAAAATPGRRRRRCPGTPSASGRGVLGTPMIESMRPTRHSINKSVNSGVGCPSFCASSPQSATPRRGDVWNDNCLLHNGCSTNVQRGVESNRMPVTTLQSRGNRNKAAVLSKPCQNCAENCHTTMALGCDLAGRGNCRFNHYCVFSGWRSAATLAKCSICCLTET